MPRQNVVIPILNHKFIIIFKLSVIDLQIQYYELTLSARQLIYLIESVCVIFPQKRKDDICLGICHLRHLCVNYSCWTRDYFLAQRQRDNVIQLQ